MIEALYIHVPWCRSKCAYCDFHSRPVGAAPGETARYVDWVRSRIREAGEAGLLDRVRTVYIGGGTPTVLGDGLVGVVSEALSWCEADEVTFEANPESLDEPLARALARAGATRASIGVQSLDPAELARIGRVHGPEEALAAVRASLEAGLRTSCDVMCGLPGQTMASWERTLSGVIATGAGHVSVYPLTVEDGTPLARAVAAGELPEPDEDFQAACMERSRDLLIAAGLEPYEVASYTRAGEACRHNIAYWTGVGYLGIGPAAASMLARDDYARAGDALGLPAASSGAARARFSWSVSDPAAVDGIEFLSAAEAAAEDLMLGMRMTAGVGEGLIERARAEIGPARLDAAVSRAIAEGLAAWRDGDRERRLAPTPRGWLMGNELYGLFWGLAADV